MAQDASYAPLPSDASSPRGALSPKGSPKVSDIEQPQSSPRGELGGDWDQKRTETLNRILEEDSRYIKPMPAIIEPEAAMKIILQHVHLDADGGLRNLDDDADNQHSKIESLKKGPLEVAMALVFCFRCGLNMSKLLHFSGGTVLLCILRENHVGHLTERYQDVHLPFISFGNHNAHLIISVAALEVLAAAVIILMFLRELFLAFFADHEMRYVRLSKCIWRDMPRLSSLSAMRAMAWIHPTMLVKHSKDFDLSDRHARSLMEKFLMDLDDSLTDEEITVRAGQLLFEKGEKYKNMDQIEKLEQSNQFLDSKPADVYAALRKEFGGLNAESRKTVLVGFDSSVLDKHWQLTLLSITERVAFLVVVVFMTLVGAGGLMAKLVEGSVIICSEGSSKTVIFWVVAFWNQLISVMAINELLLWRVQTFVFGGCDARISDEEQFIISTYLGHLFEKIWVSSKLSLFEKIACSLKLDDDDLQQLIIEEDQASKSEVLCSVKHHMEQGGEFRGFEKRLLEWIKGPKLE